MSAPSRGSHFSASDKRSGPLQHPLQEAESITGGANQLTRHTSNGDIVNNVTNLNNGHGSYNAKDGGPCDPLSSSMVSDSQGTLHSSSGEITLPSKINTVKSHG